MPTVSEEPAPNLAIDGKPLQTSQDVARFLRVRHGEMIYILYRAADDHRYTEFEIPKRTGGMRQISAPTGLVKKLQNSLKPLLQEAYNAHPAAHGFIPGRSVVSNAEGHNDRRWVLNIDLKDFFPTINFGRVRGLFMAAPFHLGPAAATICAQICTHRNGLPQGGSTSPVLSNFIATSLDRQLRRLARQNRMHYSRYADDITFSTDIDKIPASIVAFVQDKTGQTTTIAGPALERIVSDCGFSINPNKVRLQGRHERQTVTGVTVNKITNINRKRVRKVRAMIHAWKKFGLDDAAHEHFRRYRNSSNAALSNSPDKAFRNIVYGQLAYIKMVRGAGDPVFLNLCAKLIEVDMNPSKFVRQIAFGADDFDVFISHASEDKEDIARPIYQACEALGIKAFLDEEHIAWGQSFTSKINTALGAARTVLAVLSEQSVHKEWPVAEVNAALSLEITGDKNVVVVLVGSPDLTQLPLISQKKYLVWDGNPDPVARKLKEMLEPPKPPPVIPNVGRTEGAYARGSGSSPKAKQSWLRRLFGSK